MSHFASKPYMPKEEIDNTEQAVARAGQTLDRIEKTGAEFLITDLGLAITLARIAAEAADDSHKKIRNQANARHAYDDVLRISGHASLSDDKRQAVNDRLGELRSALEKLGEVFA